MSNVVTQEDSGTSAQREWFDASSFTHYANLRWDIVGWSPRKFVLNPRYPDTIQKFQNGKSNSTSIKCLRPRAYPSSDFPLLNGLVDSYTALDKLSSNDGDNCNNIMEALEYILNFDTIRETDYIDAISTIATWTAYMAYTQKKVVFAPDFTLWDKYAREFENLAKSAIKESERILDMYDMKLLADIEEGIYVRVRVLQECIIQLGPTRARDDYKKWKEEKESISTVAQRESPRPVVLSIKS